MSDIVQRLRMERRATAWRRGLDCDFPTAFEQHPLCQEAAAEITRLRAEAEALRKALAAIVDRDFTFFDGCVDRNTITYGEIQQARSALDATKGTDMTDTRQALAALLPCPFCGNSKGLAVANENPQDLSGGYFIACPSCYASTGLRFACGEDPIPLLIEQWNRRAALAAQPVAGAVATDESGWLIEHSGEILPGAEQRAQVSWLRVQMKFNGYGAREFGFTHDANEALRFARKEDAEAVLAMHLGASPPDWYSKPFSVTEHMWPLVPQPQAAPAPEPSAQAVAHPSHQTVREWMPVSEALRLSDLWTAGDLDNCGQWRAAIKVLADEVRALAASPQPAEPSAQGPLTDEQIDNLRGLDTAGRVRFYEHDFYVLSNFSAFTLQWKGRRFDTSEAAYHWEKFADRDDEVQDMILEAPSAHEAFKIAESQRAMRRADWDNVKVGIMLDILRAKAAQHEYVRRKLLATGDRELVEDSWRDDFWGWGPNRDGKNTLGRLWMQVRAELRIATPPTEPAPQAEPAAVGELPPLPATDEWIDALVMEYRQRIYPQDMHPHFERALVRAALASAPHAREPLNFDRLQSVMAAHFGGRELTDDEADSAEAFARAIERAHGIG